MTKCLVTVKAELNVRHDPRNKVQGVCPVSGFFCTDTTGAHHTVLVDEKELSSLRQLYHVTRIEEVGT